MLDTCHFLPAVPESVAAVTTGSCNVCSSPFLLPALGMIVLLLLVLAVGCCCCCKHGCRVPSLLWAWLGSLGRTTAATSQSQGGWPVAAEALQQPLLASGSAK